VPQSIWVGLAGLEVDVTLPPPIPALLTVSVKRCRLKMATTDLAALMVTVQVAPETASHPLQRSKVDPVSACAVRVTTVLLSYDAEQVDPQLIGLGVGGLELEVTVPLPLPALPSVSVKDCRLKMATTDLVALMVTVQVAPETVSHPLQLLKVDPVSACAVRVTIVPLSYKAEQAVPQLIWLALAGLELEVTVPLPLPALLTVRELRARSVLLMSTETVVEL